jgi:hypothetical protein
MMTIRWAPPIVREPAQDERHRISAQLIRTIEQLGLAHYWLALLPSRVGTYPVVDTATKAFISAGDYFKSRDLSSLRTSLRHYGDTLRMLRAAIARRTTPSLEETLPSVALLDLLEYLVREARGTIPSVWATSHSNGVAALLQSASSSRQVTDVTQAIAFFSYATISLNPIALGAPSPVEQNAQWWHSVSTFPRPAALPV